MEEAIEFVLKRLKYEHIFFLKNMVQFGAIWCIPGPILASISLLFLRLFFQNVAFADKSENKEKEEP